MYWCITTNVLVCPFVCAMLRNGMQLSYVMPALVGALHVSKVWVHAIPCHTSEVLV